MLQGRLDEGALLPGTLRQVEEAYSVFEQQYMARMRGLEPTTEWLRTSATFFGYKTALNAAATALTMLEWQLENEVQRGRAQAFVLAVLRLIRRRRASR